jgi:uncharacterized protein YegP (UPF0339 family)
MKIQVFTGKNKQYYFRIVANNGKIVLQSEGYKTKQSRKKTIMSLMIKEIDLNTPIEIID